MPLVTNTVKLKVIDTFKDIVFVVNTDTFTIKIAVKVTFISTDIVTVTVSDIVIVIVTIMFIVKFILKVKITLPQSKSELLPLIS